MRPCRSALFVILSSLLGLAGCGAFPPPPVCGGLGGTGGATPGTTNPWTVVNQPHAQEIVLPQRTFGCQPPRQAESAKVEVRDPLGNLVEASVSLSSTTVPTATVRFTPTLLGPHNVSVTFEPNLGSAQALLQAVGSFDAHEKMRLPSTCHTLQPLSSGAVLCDHRLYRSPTDVYELPEGDAYIAAGEVVWHYGSLGVRRLADTGAGPLVVTASGPNPKSPQAELYRASSEELLVLHLGALERFVHRNGAVEERAAFTFSELPPARALIRTPGGVIVAMEEFGQPTLLCQLTLEADVFSMQECLETKGEVVGADSERLWLIETAETASTGVAGRTLRTWIAAGETPKQETFWTLPGPAWTVRKSAMLSAASTVSATPNRAGGPPWILEADVTAGHNAFIPRVSNREIFLDLLKPRGDFEEPGRGAHATLAWKRASNETTVVYARVP